MALAAAVGIGVPCGDTLRDKLDAWRKAHKKGGKWSAQLSIFVESRPG
jgi:hypothetical protein